MACYFCHNVHYGNDFYVKSVKMSHWILWHWIWLHIDFYAIGFYVTLWILSLGILSQWLICYWVIFTLAITAFGFLSHWMLWHCVLCHLVYYGINFYVKLVSMSQEVSGVGYRIKLAFLTLCTESYCVIWSWEKLWLFWHGYYGTMVNMALSSVFVALCNMASDIFSQWLSIMAFGIMSHCVL